MNKITGIIIESGSRTIAADGVPIPNVVVKTTWEQLKAWHGAIYGCEVVIESTERHDAREEGIAQLCEQMWQLRVALAAREAEEERLRDVKRQRVAEGMSMWCEPQSPHLAAIADALEHAKRKHPFFADVAVSTHSASKAESDLTNCREYLEARIDAGRCSGITVLSCELAEVVEAFSRQDYAHTLEELAQCGAVIVRMMEAVQALVDEAAKAGKEAE